jgi:hypothetical protein
MKKDLREQTILGPILFEALEKGMDRLGDDVSDDEKQAYVGYLFFVTLGSLIIKTYGEDVLDDYIAQIKKERP